MEDISDLLKGWDYDPQNSIRKVIDEEGTEKIQVRVDQGAFQGILQMDLDGRPDGKKPHDHEFVLDYYEAMLEGHEKKTGSDEGYALSKPECEELFDESRRLYERYVFLLQVQDHDRVIRDTERNMAVFRFVNTYAEQEEDRLHLEKWWPYILRINATAHALKAAEVEAFGQAQEVLQEAREKIAALKEVDAEEFFAEKERSRRALEELEADMAERQPLSKAEELKKALEEAIEREEFERAAELRDRIQALGQQG